MADQYSVAGLVERKSQQQKALSQIENLPSLSTVIGEFLSLAKRDVVVAMDFERVLIKDQALVARLLKVANSSFFGSSRSINTVHEAVVLIGLDNMRDIVYAVSSSGLMRRALKCYSYPESGFWLHSMAVGMSCRALIEVAQPLPLDSEEGFITGLLHDIGKLILDDFLDAEPGKRDVALDEEREAAGFDHVELGMKILERWNIPGNVAQAVRHHHDEVDGDEPDLAGLVVNVADRLCNHWNIGTRSIMNLGAEVEFSDYAAELELLGIDEKTFTEQLFELRHKLSKIENFYSDDE